MAAERRRLKAVTLASYTLVLEIDRSLMRVPADGRRMSDFVTLAVSLLVGIAILVALVGVVMLIQRRTGRLD
jgi:hypothetical protein